MACSELALAHRYDYIVVNDDVLVLLQSKDWDNFTKILPESNWQIDLANNNWLIAEKFIK